MKTDIKCSKIVCIRSTEYSTCKFIKNHIYNVSYDTYYVIIYDDNNRQFMFHKNSPFNNGMKQKYFTDLSEIRKEKLKKLSHESNL